MCFDTFRCVEHLLDNGADPSLCNTKGYSAVHYAAAHGNKQNLELVRLIFTLMLSTVIFFFYIFEQ